MFKNARIFLRIGAVIAVFIFLMASLSFIEYLGIKKINKIQEQLTTETYVKVDLVQDMRFLARHKAVLIRNILLLKDQSAREYELQRMEKEKREYLTAQEKLADLVEQTEEQAIMVRLVSGEKETNQLWDKVLRYGMDGSIDEATRLLVNEVRNRQWGWLDALNEMVELQKEYAHANSIEDRKTTARISLTLVILNLLAIVIGLLLAVVISRSITVPLKDFTWKVNKIAQGDLSVQVDYNTKDEIGQLGKNINHMVKMRKKNLEELDAYRLHLEEMVEQRTEELSRQREEFVSVLIHDLKGPLTPILGFTRRLIEGKAKTHEDSLIYLRNIEEAAQKLLGTIEKTSHDLRDKSALDKFNPEKFNIVELTRNIAECFIPKTEDRNIILQINNLGKNDWGDIEPILYQGDPDQLKTLLENLVGNALKYTRSTIQIEIRKRKDELTLSITDDGPGIAKEYQEKIFEQYFQIPGSKKGTGIGLYSVLKVVENHHGRITLDSTPEKGSCFKIILPVAGKPALSVS